MRFKPNAFAALCLTAVMALSLGGCGATPKTDRLLYSEATQLYYRELDGYQAAVIDRDFVADIPQVAEWLDGIPQGAETQGYYEYIYSDSDSWEMFILWPRNCMGEGLTPDFDSMRFAIEDGVVQLHFEGSIQTDGPDLLLMVQAPRHGTWPTASALYVDDFAVSPRVLLHP